jgi:hypothetical protein
VIDSQDGFSIIITKLPVGYPDHAQRFFLFFGRRFCISNKTHREQEMKVKSAPVDVR